MPDEAPDKFLEPGRDMNDRRRAILRLCSSLRRQRSVYFSELSRISDRLIRVEARACTASWDVGLNAGSSPEVVSFFVPPFCSSVASDPSCASSSISVLALPFDSTGEGSTWFGYGDAGGCKESEGLEFLQPCGIDSAFAQSKNRGARGSGDLLPVQSLVEMGSVGRRRTGRVCVW